MCEAWMRFESYPGYSISNTGVIRNDKTHRILKRLILPSGEPAVSLYVSGSSVLRQVTSFMKDTWLEPHPIVHFNTVIHLDCDRENCHVDNLVLRPRWFAIKYHKEHSTDLFPNWNKSFRVVETGDVFDTAYECSRQYGALQQDVRRALWNRTPLFPGAFTLEFL